MILVLKAIAITVAVLGGLGLIFGLILAAASKVFHVETDPRLEKLNECLPGANCGGCGYAGCSAYANAVIAGEAEIGKCAAGGAETAEKMAAIMGVEAGDVARTVAFVRCTGGDASLKKFDYYGISDCLAATKIGGNGPAACSFGCTSKLTQFHTKFSGRGNPPRKWKGAASRVYMGTGPSVLGSIALCQVTNTRFASTQSSRLCLGLGDGGE